MNSRNPFIVVYDGVCSLCGTAIHFIARHDRRGVFVFTSAQSPTGQRLLAQLGLPPDKPETLVLVKGKLFWSGSDAVIEISRHLSGIWPALQWFRWLPRSVREGLYTRVSRNRYRWFGKKSRCKMPPAPVRRRFLDVPDKSTGAYGGLSPRCTATPPPQSFP